MKEFEWQIVCESQLTFANLLYLNNDSFRLKCHRKNSDRNILAVASLYSVISQSLPWSF